MALAELARSSASCLHALIFERGKFFLLRPQNNSRHGCTGDPRASGLLASHTFQLKATTEREMAFSTTSRIRGISRPAVIRVPRLSDEQKAVRAAQIRANHTVFCAAFAPLLGLSSPLSQPLRVTTVPFVSAEAASITVVLTNQQKGNALSSEGGHFFIYACPWCSRAPGSTVYHRVPASDNWSKSERVRILTDQNHAQRRMPVFASLASPPSFDAASKWHISFLRNGGDAVTATACGETVFQRSMP
jgi:hypothetical protein